MSDLNNVHVFGRVVRDATMRQTAGGTKTASFSIATNLTYRNENGETVQKGHFFPLAIYGSYAEKMLRYLKKGQRVIIDGYLRQSRWTASDGKNRSATEIGVRQIHLIFDAKRVETEKSEFPEESGADMEEPMPDITQEQMQEMLGSEPDSTDFFPDDGSYPDEDAIY